MAGANFALNTDGGAVQQQSTQSAGGSTTFQGGSGATGQSSGSVAAGGTDYAALAAAEARQGMMGLGINVEAFNKLTQGMIQPYIDRQKKEQYANGMAMASQGMAIDQIANDQPWYSKLYGPDATTQGAQMYNVNAAMNDAQTSFMQAMPQLREKAPDQVRQYLVGKMSQVQPTGDQFADAMIQQKLAEQMPQMLNTHMNQYMQFTQEQSYNGFTNLATSAGRSMQATLSADNNPSDESVAAAHAEFRSQLIRPDNMTLESYQRALRDTTIANATAGNWQAVRAMKDVPEYATMSAQMKADLDDKIPLLEAQAAAKDPTTAKQLDSAESLVFNMTKGFSPYPSTPDGHATATASMEKINADWKLQHGDATVPFTPKRIADTLREMDMNNQRQYLAGQKAQTKQLNFDQAQTLVTNAWTGRTPEALKGVPIPEGAQVQQLNSIYDDAVIQGPNSNSWSNFWVNASGNARDADMRPPKLVGFINSTLGSFFDGVGPATPQQMQVANYAQLLRQGPGGAAAVKSYFGDKGEAMLAMLDAGVKLDDPQQFDMARKQWQRGSLIQAGAQDRKEALAYVQSRSGPWWNPFRAGDLTNWDLTDGAKRNLAAQIAPLMAQKKSAFGLSDDDAAKMAYQQVLGDADLVPGAIIPSDSGKWGKGQRWTDFVMKVPGATANQNSSLYQDTMREYINDTATDLMKGRKDVDMSNFNPNDYHVQWGQYLGNGLMNLNLQKDDGSPLNITLKADAFGTRMRDKVTSGKPTTGVPDVPWAGWSY
jgi:hypothetical protein